MDWFNRLRLPISSIAGTLVIVLYCVFTFSSLALYPGPFSITVNYLSDLGNSAFNPSGAVLYNVGIILAGVALFPFFIGLYKWYTKEQWRRALIVITQLFGIASGFSLIMIGVFSEDFMAQHIFWSDVFFFLNLLVLVFANISLLTHRRFIKPIAIYGFIVAAINLVFVAISGSAIIEWFTVFSALVYAGLLVFNMLRAFSQGK